MRYILCLLTWLALFNVQANAQAPDSSFLNHAVTSLKTTTAKKTVEKVYLHLDRQNYLPGDTVWFKAYVVAGTSHELSSLSGILNIELINPLDSVIKRLKVKLNTGLGWADLILPRGKQTGKYRIRAYTNWMKNAGEDYFFDKQITVGRVVPADQSAKQADIHPDVQFFPEGGELVNGIRSRVAFKAVDKTGRGESVKGTITDNDGIEVASFQAQHAGMGVFALIPQAGKSYTAKITGKSGGTFNVPLPKAVDNGFTLTINNADKDSVYIKVAASSELFKAKQNTSFYLVGQSAGEMCYTAKGNLKAPVFMAKIERNRFPSGITQFTLFSDSGEPVNERIIFNQSNDTLNLKLGLQAGNQALRQKVKVDLNARNDEKKAVTGSFSVAVINESRVGADETAENSILSYLLLTSDLKGFIEKPNYYFVNQNEQKLADLDVLMLTQGYRRFEWKPILNKPQPRIAYKQETTLDLQGVIKTPSGDPVPNAKLTLISSRENVILDTVADANGNFAFNDLYLSDTAKIVLQARKRNDGKNVAIYVKQPDYPVVPKRISYSDINLTDGALLDEKDFTSDNKSSNTDSLRKGGQLKDVTITAKKSAKPDEYNSYGTVPEINVDVKKLRDFGTMTDAVRWGVPFIKYDHNAFIYERHQLRIIANGIEINADELESFLPSELENVRLVSPSSIQQPSLIIETKSPVNRDTTVLKQVDIKSTKAKKNVITRSSNLHGPGNADQVITGDNLGSCVSLADCLRGKVFGVSFAPDGTPINNSRGAATPMVIIVEGNQLAGSELNNIDVNTVSSIEVLRTNFAKSIYGGSIGGGALIITLKNGSEQNYATSAKPSGLITYPFKGFYKARQFYSPKYAGPRKADDAPDLRSTIYWQPNMVTDKDGKASFEYFNADTKGTYRITVEGIDENGQIGRAVYRYKVQ